MYINRLNFKTQFLVLIIILVLIMVISPLALAQDNKQKPNDAFSILVTPSPIVETMLPGQTKTIDLKVQNRSSIIDTYKISPRAFTVSGTSGDVKLDDITPPDINNWISFADPIFTIKPDQWFNQRVTISVPKNAGFSYSFALVINRLNDPAPKKSEQTLKGSVAIFTLINVDKPGATRTMQLENFSSSEKVYEYLPAQFSVKLKNSGNTIAQPYGNIFIQRTNKPNTKPLAILPVNEAHGYIIPGSVRTLTATWDAGFPANKTYKNDANNTSKTVLTWDWTKLNNFRFGKYYAKLVAVYNDGQRDVPLESTISFWVIPWKFIIFAVVLLALLIFGFVAIVKKGVNISKRVKNSVKKPKSDK